MTHHFDIKPIFYLEFWFGNNKGEIKNTLCPENIHLQGGREILSDALIWTGLYSIHHKLQLMRDNPVRYEECTLQCVHSYQLLFVYHDVSLCFPIQSLEFFLIGNIFLTPFIILSFNRLTNHKVSGTIYSLCYRPQRMRVYILKDYLLKTEQCCLQEEEDMLRYNISHK